MLPLELSKQVAKINTSVESDPMVFSVKNKAWSDQVLGEYLVWNSFILVPFKLKSRLSEQVHWFNHALLLTVLKLLKWLVYLLFFIMEIELPGESFSTRHFTVLVAEGDTHLDESQMVAISLDHLVLKFSSCVGRHIHCSRVLRVLQR